MKTTTSEKKRMIADILVRILYFAVFVSNMICIVAFIADPASYVYSYELKAATGGVAAIEGFGVAFAMWNTTYPFFIVRPRKNKTLGLVIIAQQVVGLVGELYIKSGLPAESTILSESIMRFVWFDAGGLVLLIAGYIILLVNFPQKSYNNIEYGLVYPKE